MSKTVHVKVLRSHPDFSVHPGEVTELSTEKFEKYAEKGPFFRKATAEEVEAHKAALETATAPQKTERAVLPAGAPKTPAEAAKTLEKGAKDAQNADK
jgi:hypothetical protein